MRRLQLIDSSAIEACDLDWDDFTRFDAADRARHCARCDHAVHDVSRMSELELARFLIDHPEGMCVRFELMEDRPSAAPRHRRMIPRTALDLISLRLLVVGAAIATGALAWSEVSR